MSSTTGITQPFIFSLSYLYSTCNENKVCASAALGKNKSSKEALAHVALLQRVLGSVEEVGPVCCPDPLVLGGFVFLLVVQLKIE